MAPLLTNGDTAVVDRAAYKAANPQRGDVVLLVSPENPSKLFVKLIIGVPGDELKVDGRYTDPAHPNDLPHAAVLIRPGTAGPWEILVEPYLPNQKTDPWTEMSNCCTADGRASGTPESIPLLGEDYWVLGDNRNYSADSRSFGIVAPEEILGKVFYRERGGTTTWIYAATPLLLPTG